jgi:hypothetical protein
MSETDRTIWQISAGNATRSYANEFIKYGVALLGPGDPGEWTPERSDKDFEGCYVRHLASQVKQGDIFVLRNGVARITAIGIAADDKYQYLNQFDDVNGWDVQHARRVRWYRLPQEYDFGKPVFGSNPRRLSRTWVQEVIDYAVNFVNSPPNDWQTAGLPELPIEEPTLDMMPENIKSLVAEMNDIVPLYWDNKRFGDFPKEDDLLGHFVIPFLKAHGWTTELIGVKWRNIDIAVFEKLPRIPENCRFVIEVKRFGAGVEGALEQAIGYIKAQNLKSDVVVTDGIRYRMYSFENKFEPIAYANLMRLKQKALEFFSRMKRPGR